MKRFAGIDIGSERHVVAVVDEHLAVLVKPTPFGEEAIGYQRLVELLGSPQDCLVAMEATGHYWRNLFAYLVSEGFSVALINPLRTRRFAEEELERTKTDAVDAVGIARFAAQKGPPASQPAEEDLTNCVKWCACANGSSRIMATTCANFTAHSTLVFPSSPAMYKITIVNWRLAYLPTTRPRQQSGRSRSKGWPVCVTMAVIT